MPDAKTMGRWGVAMGPVVIHQIHDRIVQIARANDVVQGRRMRIDTTVVESNIHYPTDSSLLGDSARTGTLSLSASRASAPSLRVVIRHVTGPAPV